MHVVSWNYQIIKLDICVGGWIGEYLDEQMNEWFYGYKNGGIK
jgi:hypothetical protein